jgi:hypothetical protein
MLCISTELFACSSSSPFSYRTSSATARSGRGIAYLPFAIGVVIASALASQLMSRIGPRPLIVAGAAAVAGGCSGF